MSHKLQKESTEALCCEAVRYVEETFETSDVIEEKEANMVWFTQALDK